MLSTEFTRVGCAEWNQGSGVVVVVVVIVSLVMRKLFKFKLWISPHTRLCMCEWMWMYPNCFSIGNHRSDKRETAVCVFARVKHKSMFEQYTNEWLHNLSLRLTVFRFRFACNFAFEAREQQALRTVCVFDLQALGRRRTGVNWCARAISLKMIWCLLFFLSTTADVFIIVIIIAGLFSMLWPSQPNGTTFQLAPQPHCAATLYPKCPFNTIFLT